MKYPLTNILDKIRLIGGKIQQIQDKSVAFRQVHLTRLSLRQRTGKPDLLGLISRCHPPGHREGLPHLCRRLGGRRHGHGRIISGSGEYLMCYGVGRFT